MIVDQARSNQAEQYARSFSNKAAENFLDTALLGVNQTRRRILIKYPKLQVSGLFGANRHRVDNYRIWLTDKPEEVYPAQTLYHVTGSLVVDQLLDGGKVKSMINLEELHSQSHRGIGNYLRSAIPTIFGIDLAEKDSFVWTGSSVDNEGLTLEHRRGQSSHQDTEDLLNLMFIRQNNRYSDIQPEFLNLLKQIESQDKVITAAERQYIDRFLELVFPATIIREGWFMQLKGILLREIKPDIRGYNSELVTDIVLSHINRTMHYYKPDQPSQGVVLELDPQVMFSEILKQAPYPFIPGRDPEEIVPIPFFKLNAIRRIYAVDPASLNTSTVDRLTQAGIDLKSTGEFPSTHLLDETKPAYLEDVVIEAENPLCRRRYLGDRKSKWRQRIKSGLMAPYYNINLTEKKIEQLADIFGEELFVEDKAIAERFSSVRRRVELQLENKFLAGVLESYFRP